MVVKSAFYVYFQHNEMHKVKIIRFIRVFHGRDDSDYTLIGGY